MIRERFIHIEKEGGRSMSAIMTKWCKWCKTRKPSSDFHRDRTKSDGLKTKCKKCRLEENKKHGLPIAAIFLALLFSCASEAVKYSRPVVENWDSCHVKEYQSYGRKEIHCYKFQITGVSLGSTEAWGWQAGEKE